MKKFIVTLVILVIVVAGIFYLNKSKTYTIKNPQQATSLANNNLRGGAPMQISSSAFSDGQAIPKKYTCDGEGVNPPLDFSNIPAEAKSLALVINDPDAPNGNWVHWIMWNVDPGTTSIAENSVPAGATQGVASSGQNNYGSFCPPSGIHHYIFNLYALSGKLTIPSYSTEENLKAAMQGMIVEQAQLVGLYGKAQ